LTFRRNRNIPRRPHQAKTQRDIGPRVNERIRAREVRVISHEGNQIGVFPREEALRMAQDTGLDLVEVAPEARPPVCRILDFGRYKYEQKKKTRGTKKGGSQMKELRVRPKTDEGDLMTKTKRAREFFEDGDKVMFTVLFRGRELARQDLGTDVLKRITAMLEDVAKVERTPIMEGKRMNMIMARK
jgi:translation initiation factor IF-3